MQSHKLTIFLIIFTLVSYSFGEDHGGSEAKGEKGEAKVEKKDFSGKQSLEWEKVQTKLGAMKGKLDAQLSLVESLVSNKEQLKGEALAVKMQDLKKEHLKLQKMIEEYNQLNLEFLTKYPERGIKESRLYNRVKSKSLKSYEKEMTVAGQLQRLHTKILSQYSKSNEVASKNTKKGSPKEAAVGNKSGVKAIDDSLDETKKNKTEESLKNNVTDQITFEK